MMDLNNIPRLFLYCCAGIMLYASASCSSTRNISRSAKEILFEDAAIASGHIGISIYEPATGKYWYNYDAEKNFIPASNTKLFTLYAGMKYLGDSLAGLRYYENDSMIVILPTGDPTFLLAEFRQQPVFNFLRQSRKPIKWGNFSFKSEPLGNGWAWNDYTEPYMAERSAFPMYGNTVRFRLSGDSVTSFPSYFSKNRMHQAIPANKQFTVTRRLGEKNFYTVPATDTFRSAELTFSAEEIIPLLPDTLSKPVGWTDNSLLPGDYGRMRTIHSQPTDSLFTPMMHRSDNFFAEQTLLMVSNEKLGYMSDEKIIDTLLKTDLKDVPQKPRWADASGLSRYNLFTPKSFIYILNRMKNEFGMDRLKVILATGGTGTISSYYKKDSGYIFAKTGTLSNNCALSGFIFTRSGKLLIFSVLANNYQSGATPVRRAVERFLQGIREKY